VNISSGTAPSLFQSKLKIKDANNLIFTENNLVNLINISDSSYQISLLEKHSSPVQSIQYKLRNNENWLYSIDACGVGIVSRCNELFERIGGFQVKNDARVIERGWTGILPFDSEGDLKKIITAQFFNKRITVYDEDRQIQTFNTIGNPTNIQLIPGTSTLAITEGYSLSIYDLVSNTCIKTIDSVQRDRLNGLSCTTDTIAIGGSERVVTFYDTKLWTVKNHWRNCSKYEVGSVFQRENDLDLTIVSDGIMVFCTSIFRSD
jgi:hypothetical protein